MPVKTNNIPRPVVYGFELSDKERKEFDYLDWDDEFALTTSFFRYKGELYHMGDAMRVESTNELCKGWDGYFGESFFSAVVFKDRGEYVIVGTAFC